MSSAWRSGELAAVALSLRRHPSHAEAAWAAACQALKLTPKQLFANKKLLKEVGSGNAAAFTLHASVPRLLC